MVIVDAFTHYEALNPVPHCNAYYEYTTLHEHWIAKFGLPEILVTDKGTEFINNEIITLCHLYNIKHKPRTSHAPWTNGIVEGMNRLLQEYLRCIINGNDTRYADRSADVKLFPLSYNSQITRNLGMSPYKMVFNQKPKKKLCLQQMLIKTLKVIANQTKIQYVIIYHYIHMMMITFIIHKF